ncbi:MAG: polyprenyl synthetase family protein [Rikenellaceae bacterium]
MKRTDNILERVESYIAQIDLPEEPRNLYSPITYTMSSGGKRLRPMLTMLACEIFSDDIDHALPAAAAIEIFHNFTLLHDDIMDNAELRRSLPTVHSKWGQNVAILSGDVMTILAYEQLAKVSPEYLPRVLSRFNTVAIQVCEGQQYDMDYESAPKVSVVDYMRMIELKTSVLLGGATVIGAILGGANDKQCTKMERFATELGLAFQIQDDLLDSYGDEQLGKSIGGDILEGKQTFLMVSAMSHASDEQRDRLRAIYRPDNQLSNSDKISAVKALYDELNVVQITENQIKIKFEKALSILSSLDVEPSRLEAMEVYARSLMNRKK